MSDKTYVFDSGAGNVSAMLPALLQNRGIDPAYLMGLMGNNRGNGFFGGSGGFQDIIALIVIAAIFGNGNGFGFGGNSNNRDADLLLQTLNRNGVDIGQLAQAVNVSSDQILAGINQVSGAICNLGNQMGQNTNQVLTTLLQGNNALSTQIAGCCCDIKQILSQGFSSIGYETANQTRDLQNTIKDSTAQILAGQAAIEKRELQREIATLQEEKQTYKLGSMISAATSPILAEVEKLKCKLPETYPVQYQPFTAVPNCLAAQFGLYGFPYGFNGGNGSFF